MGGAEAVHPGRPAAELTHTPRRGAGVEQGRQAESDAIPAQHRGGLKEPPFGRPHQGMQNRLEIPARPVVAAET